MNSYKVAGLTGAQLETIIIFFICALIVYVAMKYLSQCYIAWTESKTELKLKEMEIEASRLSGVEALLARKDKAIAAKSDIAADMLNNAQAHAVGDLRRRKAELLKASNENSEPPEAA